MDNKFETDDILVSSFLLSRQSILLDIVSDRPRHFVFIFEDPDSCERLVREYLNNGVSPARELFARREELITAIRHRNGYGNEYNSK